MKTFLTAIFAILVTCSTRLSWDPSSRDVDFYTIDHFKATFNRNNSNPPLNWTPFMTSQQLPEGSSLIKVMIHSYGLERYPWRSGVTLQLGLITQNIKKAKIFGQGYGIVNIFNRDSSGDYFSLNADMVSLMRGQWKIPEGQTFTIETNSQTLEVIVSIPFKNIRFAFKLDDQTWRGKKWYFFMMSSNYLAEVELLEVQQKLAAK